MSRGSVGRWLFVGRCVLVPLWCAASAWAQDQALGNAASGLKLHWRLEESLSGSGNRYALAAATAPDGSIFAIGGAGIVSGITSTLATVDVYSPRGNRWSSGPPLPSPRYRLAAATGGDGRIYAIGGFGAPGPLLNSVLALTPGSQQWVPVAPMPTARELLGASAGLDGRIYAVGGYNGNALNVLEIYDPATGQWTQAAGTAAVRYGMGVTTGSDGRIYAIGGSGNGVLNVLDSVEAYSPTSNSWAIVAPLPTHRAVVSAVTGADGRIYVIGGCELVTDSVGNPVDCAYSKRVDVYSPGTNSWQTADETTVPHREGASTLSESRIYVIAGETDVVESANTPRRAGAH